MKQLVKRELIEDEILSYVLNETKMLNYFYHVKFCKRKFTLTNARRKEIIDENNYSNNNLRKYRVMHVEIKRKKSSWEFSFSLLLIAQKKLWRRIFFLFFFFLSLKCNVYIFCSVRWQPSDTIISSTALISKKKKINHSLFL